jgi:hypothetical protein
MREEMSNRGLGIGASLNAAPEKTTEVNRSEK